MVQIYEVEDTLKTLHLFKGLSMGNLNRIVSFALNLLEIEKYFQPNGELS
jgi:hypothetical protein